MIIIDEAMSHQAYVTTGAMAVSQPSGYVWLPVLGSAVLNSMDSPFTPSIHVP